MATNTLKTRISLKTDTLQNWSSSDLVLLKGEAALARLSGELSDSFELRFGTGDKTWSQLSSSNIRIPAENVDGLTATIASLSTSFYEGQTFDELPTEGVTNGSIGVVTTAIAGGAAEKTAYVWNSLSARWEALDGNYSAENVYFKDDIPLAGGYTSVGNIKLSDGVLSSAGKSVKEIFSEIFDKTILPELGDAPTASCTLLSANSYEVGTKLTPTWSTSLVQGKYVQPWNGTTVDDGTSATAYSVTDSDGHSSTASSGTFDELTVGDSTSYLVTSKITYSEGAPAKNNKGVDTDVKRPAGTTASKNSSKITGYRAPFWGYRLATDEQLDFDSLSSGDVRALNKAGTSTAGLPTSYTVPAGTKQIVFAAKAGTKTSMTAKDENALGAPVTFTKKASGVQVEGKDGYAAAAYDFWYVVLDSATGAAKEMKLAITWTK